MCAHTCTDLNTTKMHTWTDSYSDSEMRRVAADPSPIFTQAYESVVCVFLLVCVSVYSRGFPF